MWFQIELAEAATIAEVHLDSVVPGGRGRGGRGAGPPTVGPVAFSVQVSMDGLTWPGPVAQGNGATPSTVIALPRAPARFVRITQTGTAVNGELWGIQQVRLLAVK